MGRILSLIICSALYFSNLFSLSQEIQEIVDRGELKVALLNQNEFPFFFTSLEGELVGSDVDLAKEVAKELGVKAVFDRSYTTYNAVVEAIAQKRADVAISNISKTLPRAKSVFFSTPYNKVHIGLAVNRKRLAQNRDADQNIVSYINRERLKIGSLGNAAFFPIAQKIFPNSEIVPISSSQDGFLAVEEDRIFAFFTDEFELDAFIVSKPNKSIHIKTILFQDLLDQLSIAIRSDKPQLLYYLNTFLELAPPQYTPEKLFTKYYPYLKSKGDDDSNH